MNLATYNRDKWDELILTMILLVNAGFFDLAFFPKKFFALSLIPIVYYSIIYRNKQLMFARNVHSFFIFLLISCISSKFNRSQGFIYSFSTDMFLNLCSIYIYFYVAGKRIPLKMLRKVILNLFWTFCFLYIIQYLIYPLQLLKFNDVTSEISRFKLSGQIIVSLGYFICLNKFKIGVKYKVGLIMALLLYLLMGFRTFFFFIVFPTIFLLMRKGITAAELLKYAWAGTLVLVILSFTPLFQQRVNEMIEKQKTDTFNNEDYVRVIELKYYLTEHFKNRYEVLFGSGIPSYHSNYGKKYIYFAGDTDVQYNYVRAGWIDLGLFGLSCIIGIITVFILLWMLYKAIRLPQLSSNINVPCTIVFLVLVSFTTMEIYRMGSFIYVGLLLYMAEKGYLEYKYGKLLLLLMVYNRRRIRE